MTKILNSDQYGEKEANDRFEASIKGALNTPPQPRKKREPSKPGSRRGSNEKANKPNNGPKAQS